MSKFSLDNFYTGKLKEPIYEDNKCIVYDEKLNPQATVHFLVFPKKAISKLACASTEDEKLLGHLILVANKIAVQKGYIGGRYDIRITEDLHSTTFLHLKVATTELNLWPITPRSRY